MVLFRVHACCQFDGLFNVCLCPPYVIRASGIDIAIEDENGYTPMHYAAAAGNSAIIRFLYEKGAGVESIDAAG